jgi:hypothetical protein
MRKLNRLLIPLTLVVLASCTSNRYATTGPYESDEVYYTSDENYISDFALVDDIGSEVSPQNQTDSAFSSESTEEYYTPDGGITNNYYGNVYQSPWMNSPGYWNSGFGCFNYGTLWNTWGPTMQLGWSPWSGWYTTFNYNWGWNCGWHQPYAGFGWWNSPFYDPWGWNNGWYGYQPWGWNPYWNSPFNYYYPGFYNNGWAWNNGGWFGETNNNGFVFGPRNPIAVTNSVNSTYTDEVFYKGNKEGEAQTGAISNGQVFEPVTPAAGQVPSAQPGNLAGKPETVQIQNGAKPQLNPVTSNGIISVNDKPEITQGSTSPFKPSSNYKPGAAGAVKPGPSYTLDRPSAGQSVPSSKPGMGVPASGNGIATEQTRETRSPQPDRIRMNEPVRTKPPVQQNPQLQQRKPSPVQTPSVNPGRNVQPERNTKPSIQQPQRREPEISKPKQQESRPQQRPSPSINRESSPSRSTPSSPSSPSRSGGGGGSAPRRK